MKAKMIFVTLLGLGALPLSHMAVAGWWYDGPCSAAEKSGPAPCIEVKIGEDYYHYNGGEFDEHDPGNPHIGHDDWHGGPDPLGDITKGTGTL